MKIIYRYYKNSNTGDVVKSQEFTETKIKNIPIYFYRNERKIAYVDMEGYVEISERKYKRILRKNKAKFK